MKEDIKELAEGIESIAVFNRENTLRYAKIFEESGQSPLALVWNKILKEKIKGFYYRLAHLSKETRDVATVSFISGIIQSLEILLNTPAEFMKSAEEIEKEEEKGIKP